MLLDPENLEYWQKPVRASNLKEATSKCQNIADHWGMTNLIDVTQLTKTKDRDGKVKYLCHFETETELDDDDSNQA